MGTGTIIVLVIFASLVFFCIYISKIILNYDTTNPVKAIGWILAIVFFPVIGLLLYIIIGRNLTKKRSLFRRLNNEIKKKTKLKYGFDHSDQKELCKEHYELKRLLRNLNSMPLFPGNSIEFFSNGKSKFESLFQDMENAKQHIHVFYYTIGGDKIGKQFRDLILRKHKEGVEVRIMYDDIGTGETKDSFFEEIKQNGIPVAAFSPVSFPRMIKSVNYRNHKKIVVIDGEISYTGGFNIKDNYIEGVKWGIWRDNHLRIQGPATQGLQTLFLTDWYYAYHEMLEDQKYFPEVKNYGNNLIQVVSSEPVGETKNILQGMFEAINRAKKSVYIETPYFVPTESLLTAIQTIALSGIEVHLIMPRKSDNAKVQYASNSYVQQLLSCNVRVYQYNVGFIHSKLMVIDDEITIAGSSNLDIRSLELNFEGNVFIYNRETAAKAKEIIFRDINDSIELNSEEWRIRPAKIKFIEAVFRLFSPLL